MAVQPGRKHGIDLGAKCRRKLWQFERPLKWLALSMGYHEGSQVSRSCDGVKGFPFDLWKFLDVAFNADGSVNPEGASFVRQFLLELCTDVRKLEMAKAGIQPANQERKIS